MNDPGIVRNRAKIDACISNAIAYLEIEAQQGFAPYLWNFVDGKPVQNTFRSMGEIGGDAARPHHLQGSQAARLQIRRADDRLCLHAGGRHGQRPCGDVLPPWGGEAAGDAETMMAVQRGSEAPPRAWQRMLSGRRLDLLDPSPLDIEIEDIAHGLARVARWNGQTSGDSRLLGGAALPHG